MIEHSLEYYRTYANCKDENARYSCVCEQNKNISAEALDLFVNDESYLVRFAVARHPNTSEDTLMKIAKTTEYMGEGICILTNSKVTTEIIDTLVNSFDYSLFLAECLGHKQCTEELALKIKAMLHFKSQL